MGLFNHSELALLEESLKALPWESLLENPRLVLLQARLMQSQHRYSEVNTLLARAEQEIKGLWTARCMLNLTRCAPCRHQRRQSGGG